MPVALGIDLGTTTITALALDTSSGEILAGASAPNRADITSAADRAQGRSEWDVQAIGRAACACLADVSGALGKRAGELAGLGVTGQQHGGVLVDAELRPLTPLFGWQDRRADEELPGSGVSYVRR